jgi:hypothetical protein
MRQWKRKHLGVGVAAALLFAAAGLWFAREPLLAWYYLRGLARADDAERPCWAERVAGLDRAALPALLDLLTGDDRACASARAGLDALARRRVGDGPRAAELARRLSEGFPRLGPAGRREVLQFEASWLRSDSPPPDVARLLTRELEEAARSGDGLVRGAALDLAAALLERPDCAEAVGSCRELALACFNDPDAENRARSAQLALFPGMDLQQQALPLLRDPAPEVRRLAMLAVGPAPNVISTDDLLHWLHDPDAEVRRLCEVALGSRRVPREHIRLGRTLTHPDHRVRLRVLDELRGDAGRDIDASIWLRYLTHDAKESVRVAAVRAAVEGRFGAPVDLRDRLEQMARTDPSATVRQEAGYYLSKIKP